MSAARLTAPSCAAMALALVLALAGCNRNPTAPAPATSSASAAAAPASAASAPAALAPPLVPKEVPLVAVGANEDPAPGQQLATQGAQGVAACAGCHGAGGEGNPQTGFPRLAGLGKHYLVWQLESYANGNRANAIMTPIATAMTPAQRLAAAVYYSSAGQQASNGGAAAGAGQGDAAAGAAPGGAATGSGNRAAMGAAASGGGRGALLASQGDDRRGLQACANCHGPQGIGDAAANPYLAGQHAAYLTAVLGEWKDGSRKNDPSGQMPAIAKALNDDDVKAVVSYYSALAPPLPRNAQAAAVMPPPSRAAVQSGPAGATAPVQGTGTEQGALTGGAQTQGTGGAATNPAQTPGTPAAR